MGAFGGGLGSGGVYRGRGGGLKAEGGVGGAGAAGGVGGGSFSAQNPSLRIPSARNL